ncbi:MAG: fused MFS/spermidine synthase, partial [Deltaproteobacteria bacterium]|nr:fused MFS/spermidine synthase [Deltaproteobacteria bacterium]
VATGLLLAQPLRRRSLQWGALAACWALGAVVALTVQPWSRALMISGPYLGRGISTGDEILFYAEGIDTTVAVTARPGREFISLRVNGKPDASTLIQDMTTALLTGHVPLLVRPAARDVCVIGLGSGATAGAVLAHPVTSLDVAEISTDVVEASHFFDDHNDRALQDPRLRLHHADGRNFLLATDRRYDAIISEPSNPWISGITNLFTREFFELARSRLNPGGVHAQWLQAYGVSREDFSGIIGTMAGVFPHLQLWQLAFNDFLLLGSDQPIRLDLPQAYLAMLRPAVRRSLARIYLREPLQLARLMVSDGEELAPCVAEVPPITDDHPWLEFSAPRHLHHGESTLIVELLALCSADRRQPAAGDWPATVFAEYRRSGDSVRRHYITARSTTDYRRCLDALLEMAAAAPDDGRVLFLAFGVLQDMRILAPRDPQLLADFDRFVEQLGAVAPGIGQAFRDRLQNLMRLPWPLGGTVPPPDDEKLRRTLERLDDALAGQAPVDASALARDLWRSQGESPSAWSAVGEKLLASGAAGLAVPFLQRAWAMAPQRAGIGLLVARAFLGAGDRPLATRALGLALQQEAALRTTVAADPELAPLLLDLDATGATR